MRKRICLFLSFLILVPIVLVSQNNEIIEARGDQYRVECKKYFNINMDSTILYAKKAMKDYKEVEAWDKYIEMLNRVCTAYYSMGNYAKYQECTQKALKEAEIYLGLNSQGLSDAMCNYSVFLNQIGDHYKSIEFLERALVIENEIGSGEAKAVTFGNLGGVYLRTGDYDEALRYFFKVIAMGKEGETKLSSSLWINNYNKIGQVFLRKEELDSAKVYFRKSLLYNNKNPKPGEIEYEQKIISNFELAEIYFKQNKADRVRFYVDRSIELSKGDYFNHRERAYEILGKLSLKNKDYNKAHDFFLKSKNINANKYKAYKKHYSFAEKEILLAKNRHLKGDLDHALAYYHKALSILSRENLSEDYFQHPPLENIYSRFIFLEALVGKAKVFFDLYKKENGRKNIEAAYETYELAVQLIHEIRLDYQQEESLLQLSTSVLSIYENAIATALELHEITNDKEYLNRAFVFCEGNKATLLLESINENRAKYFSGIPDSLLQKEQDLKNKIAFYERQINEKLSISGATKNVQTMVDQLFDLDEAYKGIINYFEEAYPKYYQLKYSKTIPNVDLIQSVLENSETAVIEYFVGEKNIYVFSLTAQDVFVDIVKREEKLFHSISEIRTFLSQPPSNDDEENFENYVNAACYVYQEILEQNIPEKINHLVIVADDRLGQLPFEVLLTELPASEQLSFSPNHLQYLLEEFEISYSYSASLFRDNFSIPSKKMANVFLGVAPSFDNPRESAQRLCDEQNLYNLNCNQTEVAAIKSQFKGNVLVGPEATKSSFIQQADQYQILHLATHACLDDQNPEFSKIYFTDDYISNNELYNLQLNSDLVVLSACDTGAGQLAKGEGVMSLARGFIHAGCPSIVMSLWSVDDCATSKVMDHFYTNLNQQVTKSKAIQQAKLDYLSQAKKAEQHPFFWAGFVQIGNYQPIESTTMSFSTVAKSAIALSFIVLLSIFFFYRKK